MGLSNKDFDFQTLKAINFVNLPQTTLIEILSWRNHASIREHMFSDSIITVDDHLCFVSNLRNQNRDYYWLVTDANIKKYGVIYLTDLNATHQRANLGLYVNCNDSSKNKGRLLMNCLHKIAFDEFMLHGLRLEVLEDNQRAISLYKHFGFENEGLLRDYVYKNSKWKNVIVMSKIRQ